MFGGYTISLHRVHDSVRIREGDDALTLAVDADPMRMVAGLNQAQKTLQAITSESTEEETRAAAAFFAGIIFGQAQAEQLMAFYHGDAACVINVCGKYFSERLSKLIARAQKRK